MSVILRESPDRTEELARLVTADPGSRRVLVAYGEGDDAWPTDVQDEMARRLGSAAVVLAGAGHSPAAESHRSPASTVELLHRFWSADADSDGESTQRADSV
jgi:pimeloyl-ACP methyl ester carboxylesterase